MKKALLLTSLLLALTASVALAAGVNVAWGPICYTENQTNETVFLCNTNSTTYGNRTIVTSYMLADPLPLVYAYEWVLRGNSDGGVLVDWWKFQTAACRAGKATASAGIMGVGDICLDLLDGLTPTPAAINQQIGEIMIIKLGCAVGTTLARPADAGVEYTSGGVVIANSKTVGTGACAGCLAGMKIGLDYIKVVSKNAVVGQPDINVIMTTPLTNGEVVGNQCLSWNNSIQQCARPVPARNTTWGQVKSLYR